MTWFGAIPVAVQAVACVLLPGLVALYLLGVRGVAAWGAAPAVSIGALALTAVLAGQLGVPWSPPVAVGGALVLACVAPAVRRVAPLVRGRGDRDPPGGVEVGRATAVAAVLGMAVAAAVATVTARLGMGAVDQLSQTYDAVFHYNAVADILDTGNASSLTLARITSPGAVLAFYPAAWHDLVSTVVLTSGVSVPAASNVLAIVVVGLVWPLSCLLLVRQLTGRSPVAMAITPVVALGFIAFPWSLLGFGVLWPNLIGLALVPVGLAAVLTLCGLARESALTRGQALVIGAFTVVALALAHPNTVFSLAVLAVAPFLWWLVARLRALAGAGRWVAASATVVAVLAAAAAAGYFVLFSPLLDSVRSFDWPAFEAPPRAAAEVLLNSTNSRSPAWIVSLVLVVGAVAAALARPTRWLIPAHLASGALYLLAASLETETAAALTGLWYNDSYRLAAVLPITGVPLVVIGLLAVGRVAARWSVRVPLPAGQRAAAVTVIAAVLTAVISSGLYLKEHADDLAETYTDTPSDGTVLTPQHRDFLEEVGRLVPPDAVVAQNPWTGSALLWALTDRKVLFPHLDGQWDADQRYLADHLDDVGHDPAVCSIASRLDVQYVLTGEEQFWPWDGRSARYPGLDDVATAGGFELVATGPQAYRLYRLTACGAGLGGSS